MDGPITGPVLTGRRVGQMAGKKKEKCKNCEGKRLVKHGDKKVKCQRCAGTGFYSRD